MQIPKLQRNPTCEPLTGHPQDSESNPVRDLHYDSGSTIEMVCRVRRPPAYHTRVVWEARYAHSPGRLAVLNQDVTRGGVKGRDSALVFIRK